MERYPGTTFAAAGDMTRAQVAHVLFRRRGKRGELIPYGIPERPSPKLTPRRQAERRYLLLGVPPHRLGEVLAEDEAKAADVRHQQEARLKELKRRAEERQSKRRGRRGRP